MHTFKNYRLNKSAKRQKYQWVLNGQMLPGRICIINSIVEYHVIRASKCIDAQIRDRRIAGIPHMHVAWDGN